MVRCKKACIFHAGLFLCYLLLLVSNQVQVAELLQLFLQIQPGWLPVVLGAIEVNIDGRITAYIDIPAY
jgi:hypothetical protein